MPSAQQFWIYYQLLVVGGTVVMAISNVVTAIAIWRFVREAIPRLQKIESATAVVKFDILKKTIDKRRGELGLEPTESGPDKRF